MLYPVSAGQVPRFKHILLTKKLITSNRFFEFIIKLYLAVWLKSRANVYVVLELCIIFSKINIANMHVRFQQFKDNIFPKVILNVFCIVYMFYFFIFIQYAGFY